VKNTVSEPFCTLQSQLFTSQAAVVEYNRHQLAQTPLGSRVVCEERDLLYKEAPAAYKNIEAVIEDLVTDGLVSVIATLRPLLTYKTRKAQR
jgi:release factor H-coupled RctB family protein